MGLMPRQRRLKIAGTFRLGLFEFDHSYGFVDLETAYLLTGQIRPDHLEIRVADIYNAPAVADEIPGAARLRLPDAGLVGHEPVVYSALCSRRSRWASASA